MTPEESRQLVLRILAVIALGVKLYSILAETPVNPAWFGRRDPVATDMARP